MAIALVATGARTKADTSASGVTQSIALPTGHLSGHWLLLTVITEDNTGPTTPSGWTVLGTYAAGTSTQVPYVARPHTWLYGRIDNGSLGASVSLTFSSASWPSGKPYVLAWTEAYSGVDNSAPVENIQANTTTATTAAQAHPNPNAAVTGDWGIYIRAVNSDSAVTFTDSVGTDVERVDDTTGFPASPSAALYDSNAGLTAGAQTQRTTTASGTATYGSVAVTIYIKPASVAGATTAVAQTAVVTATANDAAATAVIGPWDLCSPGGLPTYRVAVDWNADGDFTDLRENITGDVISEFTATYGRDQERQLNPAGVGNASLTLINVDRTYSPENPASPLSGDLDPARPMIADVTLGGTTFALFKGRIDDFELHADFTNRTVAFTFLDSLNDLSAVTISTPVYQAMRTGELINIILDTVGWTAGRDIDLGATFLGFWWVEGVNALQAINDLVKAEGPPAVAYVALDGTFMFHDRHHRIQNASSITPQGYYTAAPVDCHVVGGQEALFGPTATGQGTSATNDYLVTADSDATDIQLGDKIRLYTSSGALKENTIFTVTSMASAFGFTNIYFSPNAAVPTVSGDVLKTGYFRRDGDLTIAQPFTYSHGWRDIINSVTFEVTERRADTNLTDVWTNGEIVTIGSGESRDIIVSTSDPFIDAVTPVQGTDYTVFGAGTLTVGLNRDSGATTKITLTATGGAVTVHDLKLRARAIPTVKTTKISRKDPGSITTHGERTYPDTSTLAGVNDADAVASAILLRYAQRRPTVQIRVVTQDPEHFAQILSRMISDRIHITNGEIKLDDDFYIERITHTVKRWNQAGKPPVHSVIFGCEKAPLQQANPFRFDVKGAGFDDGVFDPLAADSPYTVFIFGQGVFDTHVYGT